MNQIFRCLRLVVAYLIVLLVLAGCHAETLTFQNLQTVFEGPNFNRSVTIEGLSLYPNQKITVLALNQKAQAQDQAEIYDERAVVYSDTQPSSVINGSSVYPFRAEVVVETSSEAMYWPEGGMAFVKIVLGDNEEQLSISSPYELIDCLSQFDGASGLDGCAKTEEAPVRVLLDMDPVQQSSNITFLTTKYDARGDTVRQIRRHGREYYEAIGARNAFTIETRTRFGLRRTTVNKETLNGFKAIHAFDSDELPKATFYNGGDFGLGRKVSCRIKDSDVAVAAGINDFVPPPETISRAESNNNRPGNVINNNQVQNIRIENIERIIGDDDEIAVVCLSENFGSVDFDIGVERSLDLATDPREIPFASVAMEYVKNSDKNTPNGVRFYVYDQTGDLLPSAILDSEGEKRIPDICTSCHGGYYDSQAGELVGASFLPLDVPAFDFSEKVNFTRAVQEDVMRMLNKVIMQTGATAATQAFVDSLYENDSSFRANDSNVPQGWTDRPQLYHEVYSPYCRTCHQTSLAFPFKSSDEFIVAKDLIVAAVCETYTMPHAERTLRNFWNSEARLTLMSELQVTHACEPQSE